VTGTNIDVEYKSLSHDLSGIILAGHCVKIGGLAVRLNMNSCH